MADNKVRYGFKNVYYSVLTEGDDAIIYAAPKAWKGAKSISLDPSGETSIFYADDTAYYTTSTSNGYTGTLEMAYLSDEVKKDIFGFQESQDGMLLEIANSQPKNVALIFECQGDLKAKRHLYYKVTFARPSFEAATKEESVEPTTESLEITITPITVGDNEITKATAEKGSANYDTIFTTAPAEPKIKATE